jgi:acid stress-induced BolA-like protein IbaG/YrbA
MQIDVIKSLIQMHLPKAIIKIDTEDERHFFAEVISDEFLSKNSVQRQRLVYTALGDNIANGNIHAISLKTYTKEEWEHNA